MDVGQGVRIIGHTWQIGRHAHIQNISNGKVLIRDSYGLAWMDPEDLEPCEHQHPECVPEKVPADT